MGEDYKLIAAITPNTTNWTEKVVVLEKTSARTAYHSPTKYQNVVLMDMEGSQSQQNLTAPSATMPQLNKQLNFTIAAPFWVEARAYVRVFNQSFWYMACDICNKISSASFGETYDCIFCKSPNARATARARVFVELEDLMASINGTMIGKPAERMVQCSADRLVALTSPDNQLQVLDEARITVEENHLVYLKAVKNDGPTGKWKYDIIFMIEPSTMTENVQEVNHPEHSSSTSQNMNFVPQLMPPPAKRMIFEVPPIPTSKKRLAEETHLHGNAQTVVLKLSASATSAMKNKEKVPATK
ncbi:Replication factor-A C terminal domain-containing protein [Forsythia ovata]|uniref:Replication factor-A C terminal domain-containing protein n=1 Tax=Forsythia ovata TaxID=205694 RepID=A0ABD1TR29_9LAMI